MEIERQISGCMQLIKLTLTKGEEVIVHDPQRIWAFQGQLQQREDFWVRPLPGTSWKKSRLIGPLTAILCTGGYSHVETLDLAGEEIFFNSNLLFHFGKVEVDYKMLPLTDSYFSERLITKKISGCGVLGYWGNGGIVNMDLKENEILYAPITSILGYSASAKYEICTYGNITAAYGMPWQYKFTGACRIIMQAQIPDIDYEEIVRKYSRDGIFTRIAKQIIPFGEVIIP